jgi:4-amino-4-deoxy-L-arabinose transferase-like glycosyltransferase
MRRHFSVFVDLSLIITISLLLFVAFTGSYHLIIPDEGRYAEVAREILASGNWITPHLNGMVYLDKPMLMYWFEAISMHFFGVNEFAARLPPVLLGSFGVVLTYIASRVLYNRRTALISSFVLMTSLLYFLSAHYVDMDLAVAVFTSGALFFFIMAIKTTTKAQRNAFLWVAYTFAALAVLTKGLIGIVFPLMIIGVWILLLHEWRQLKRMCLLSGFALFFLITLPWYVLVQIKNPGFFHYFFVEQQFERFLTSSFNVHNPFYFYFIVILAGMLPWVVFLFQALWSAIKNVLAHWRGANVELFLLLWVFLITLFFSIPDSKIVGYITPIFPAMAVLIGHYLNEKWETLAQSKSLRWALAVLFVLGLILMIAAITVSFMPSLTASASRPYLFTLATLLLITTLVLWWLRRQKARFATLFIFLCAMAMLLSVIGAAGVHTFQLKNQKALALLVKKAYKPGDKVVSFYHYSQELPFYIQHRVYIVWPNWSAPGMRKGDNWRSEFAQSIAFTPDPKYLLGFKQFKALWKSGARLLVIVSKHKRSILEHQVGKNYRILAQSGHTLLISNEPKTTQATPALDLAKQPPYINKQASKK